jgi:hypothetical protein
MYIAVQSNPIAGSSDNRTYSESVTGVYVWDRQSTIVGAKDFIPLYGVRDIKSLFVDHNGDIKAICIGDDRFTQVRSISPGNGKIVGKAGMSAYPETRDSVKIMNGLTVWLGSDGIFYAHGSFLEEKSQTFKIGDMSGNASGAFTPGAILVGNEESSQSRQGIVFSYTDTADDKIRRWYPHGEGTIDTADQLGNQGNVYTLVRYIPSNSTVNHINIYMLPTSSSGATTIANIKPYFNQSSTAWATKTISQKEASTGLKYIQIGKPNINAVQIEVEFNTTDALGDDDFVPVAMVVDYTPTDNIQA